MKAILDTHVWLWMLAEPERLGPSTSSLIEGDAELLLSAASSWEISIKYGIGKLDLPAPPHHYLPALIRATGVTALPIEHSHALAVSLLPDHHRDPFDRMLVAQARVEDLPLLSADPRLTRYDIEVIDATT